MNIQGCDPMLLALGSGSWHTDSDSGPGTLGAGAGAGGCTWRRGTRTSRWGASSTGEPREASALVPGFSQASLAESDESSPSLQTPSD